MSDDNDELDVTIDEFQARTDAFVNQIAGLGIAGKDRSSGTFICDRPYLDKSMLDSLYSQNPIARRICDRPAGDMTREGFTVEGVMPELWTFTESRLQTLGLSGWLATGERWARQYGGALGVIDVFDGRPKHAPVDMKNIKRVNSLRVVDAASARPVGTIRMNSNGQAYPEEYDVTWPGSLKTTRVHHTRTVRFEGIQLPVDKQSELQYWGMSELEPVYDDLRRLYVVRQYLENFIHEISIVVMKIKNLRTMSKGKDGSGRPNDQKVAEALASLRLHATVFNWLGIDSEDDYRVESKPTAGLEALEMRFVDAVGMATDLPRVVLLNEVMGGLNSGENAGEMRAYYDWIGARQVERFTPHVSRVLDLEWASQENKSVMFARNQMPHSGIEAPEEYSIEWNALWRQGDKEQADQDKVTAETDAIRINSGVVSAAEVRRVRLVEGVRGELRVDPPDPDKPAPMPVASPTQVDVLSSLAEKVTAGLILPDTAIGLAVLSVPGLTREAAEQIVAPYGDVGATAAGVAAEAGLEGDEEPIDQADPPDLSSLVDIVNRVRLGELTPQAAHELISLSFPAIEPERIGNLIAAIGAAAVPAGVEAETDENPVAELLAWLGYEPAGEASDEPAASMEPMPSDVGTAQAVAAAVGISASTIRTMARKGMIRYWKFNTIKRYSVSEVQAAGQAHWESADGQDDERSDYVRKVGNEWGVFSKAGELIGKHATEEEANAQLAAIEANKDEDDDGEG